MAVKGMENGALLSSMGFHVDESLRDSLPVSERPDHVGCSPANLHSSWNRAPTVMYDRRIGLVG
jgi:hypothetical protein